VTFTFTFE